MSLNNGVRPVRCALCVMTLLVVGVVSVDLGELSMGLESHGGCDDVAVAGEGTGVAACALVFRGRSVPACCSHSCSSFVRLASSSVLFPWSS